MGYYEDKVLPENKHSADALAELVVDWIGDLQDELKKAARQIDKLDRKLRIRSKRLGEARGEVSKKGGYDQGYLEGYSDAASDAIEMANMRDE